jgi:hypothetical protein
MTFDEEMRAGLPVTLILIHVDCGGALTDDVMENVDLTATWTLYVSYDLAAGSPVGGNALMNGSPR